MNPNILKEIQEPVFFVTNDAGRAVGLEAVLPNYHIVCLDDHSLVDLLQKAGISVFCLERALSGRNIFRRSTGLVLEHPLTLSFIREKSQGQVPNILFFKPQEKIERIAQKCGFKLIGNYSRLNSLFEDKISFFKLFGREVPLPPAEIIELSKLDFDQFAGKYGLPLVIQFGFGWAGSSTFFVRSAEELIQIKKRYKNIEVKAGRFINGKTVLNNAVVTGAGEVFQSPPALQIAADEILTVNPGGTGGRQWPAEISDGQKKTIYEITRKMGILMNKKSYRGFFGLDFLIEESSGEVLVSENNARLTASSAFYTKLELNSGCFPLLGLHLLSFLRPKFVFAGAESTDKIKGSEIVGKNTAGFPVMVTGELPVGIYNQNLEYKRESYCLNKTGKDEFWLTSAACGRKVNPEIELVRINFSEKVCEDNGILKKEFREIMQKVRHSLKLQESR